MSETPRPDFAAWALGYGGMDGGNVQAKLWFCGIEWGAGDSEISPDINEYFRVKSQAELLQSKDWLMFDEGYKNCSGDRIPYIIPKDPETNNINKKLMINGRKYPFAARQAKIVAGYHYGRIDLWKEINWNTLSGMPEVATDIGSFKMNLYPLAFKDVSNLNWTDRHREITGFSTKDNYKKWCMDHRFPKLKQLVAEYNPEVLICFGITLEKEFMVAFGDKDGNQSGSKVIGSGSSERTLKYCQINNGKTTLLISPFPTGQHGLNSNALISEVVNFSWELAKTPDITSSK